MLQHRAGHVLTTFQAGVAEELVRRDHAVLAGTKVGSQKDVLTRLCEQCCRYACPC